MKNFFSNFRNFKSRSSRFVFMESDFSSGQEEEEIKLEGSLERDELNLALGLQTTSFQKIKDLDKKSAGLKKTNNKEKFQTLVEHRLFLAESNDFLDTFPPRILYAIRDSDNLKQYLTSQQKSRIERVFDSERIEIKSCADENWRGYSSAKLLKICAFFETLKTEQSGKNDQELFSKLAEKLYEEAFSLLYSRTKQKREWSVDDVPQRDRLLFLEIYRIHPDRSDWKISFREDGEDKNMKDLVKTFSGEVSKDIIKGENNRETILFWETIESLQKKRFLEPDNDELIQKRITRNNSAQLIVWAKNQNTVLPEQFKILQTLTNDDYFKEAEYYSAVTPEEKITEDLEDYKTVLEVELKEVSVLIQTGQQEEQIEFLERQVENNLNLSLKNKASEIKTQKLELEVKKRKLEDVFLSCPEILKNSVKDVIKFDDLFSEGIVDLDNNWENALENVLQDELEKFDIKRARILNSSIEYPNKQLDVHKIESEKRKLETNFANFKAFFVDKVEAFIDIKENLTTTKREFQTSFLEYAQEDGILSQKIKATAEKIDKREPLNLEGIVATLEAPQKESIDAVKNIKVSMQNRFKNKRVLANDLLILFNNENDSAFLAEILTSKFDETGKEKELETRKVEAKKKLDLIKQVRQNILNTIERSQSDTPKELRKKFGQANVHKEFLKSGNKILFEEAFDGDPKMQNRSEIVSGLILSYKDEINKVLEFRSEDTKNDFWKKFNNTNRFHSNLDKRRGEGFTEAQRKYKEDKGVDDVLVSKENAEIEKIIAEKNRIPEQKAKIKELAKINKNRFLNGYLHKTEDNKEIWIAGVDSITTLQLQSAPIAEEIENIMSSLGLEVDQIKSQLQNIDRLDTAKAVARIENLCGEFGEIDDRVKSRISEMRVIMEDIFGNNYKNGFSDYLDSISVAWGRIGDTFDELEDLSQTETLDGFEPVFSTLASSLKDFKEVFDTKNGFWEKELARNRLEFDKQSDGLRNLEEKGLWDDEGNEQYDEAGVKFEESRQKYNEEYKRYNKTISRTIKAISADLNKYDDDEFQLKYKFSKELGRGMISEIASANSYFDDYWQGFNNGEFWDNFTNKWKNGSAEERVIVLDDLSYWEGLQGHIQKMADNAEVNEEFIEDRKKNKTGTLDKVKSLNVEFFSLYNIYTVIKQTIDARERIWKQRMDVVTNKIGKNLFGNSGVGKEFDRNLQTAENARMNEFKTAYENNTTTYELWELLRDSNDKYEIEAVINILNTRGILRWDDPILFAALNKLGGKITYNENDSMVQVRKKIKNACASIWSEEMFDQWNCSYESNLKSKKEKFSTEFEENPNSAPLKEMLKLWNAGSDNTEDVDPVKFEAFLEMAIKNGKMGLEDKIYYLIMGVTTKNPKNGKTLLSKETFKRFAQGEYFQAIPQMIFFDPTEHSHKKDGIPYPPEEAEAAGAEARDWNQNDYECWREMIDEGDGQFEHGARTKHFITRVVEQSMDVRKRFDRLTNAPSKMDHDDAPGRFTGLSVNMILAWGVDDSNGPPKISPDCWKGFMKGANMWFANYYQFIKDGDEGKLSEIYPDWPAKKKVLLLEVAEKLRVALAISQMLKGNFYKKASINLRGKEWTGTSEDAAYGLCAKRDSDKFETAIETLFEKNGLNKSVDGDKPQIKDANGKLIGKKYYREIFDRSKMVSEDSFIDQKDLNIKNQEIMTGDKFFKDYFSKDPKHIEEVLEQFYSGAWDDPKGVRKSGGPVF